MKVNDKSFEAVKNACEHALIREKDRMLSQIVKTVLKEMIKKFDEQGPTSA